MQQFFRGIRGGAGLIGLLFVVLAAAALPLHAQSGYPPAATLPDLRLEISGEVNVIARYDDGGTIYYLIGGQFEQVNGVARRNLARLNADGTLDNSFHLDTNGRVLALAVDGSSSLFIGGEFTGVAGEARTYAAKINLASATVDAAWVSVFDAPVQALTLDGSGNLYAGGLFSTGGGLGQKFVVKLGSDGSGIGAWNAQLQGGTGVFALHFDAVADRLYVGGHFVKTAGTNTRAMVRLMPSNGARDAAWNPNFSPAGGARVYAITADATSVFVGGQFRRVNNNVNRASLARLAKTDATAQAWNPGSDGPVWSLATDGAGAIYAGGEFTTVGGAARLRLAKLSDASNNADAGWQADADRIVHGLLVDAVTGQLLAGGAFSELDAVAEGGIARLAAADGASDAGFAASAGGTGRALSAAMDAAGGVIVGGSFDGVRDPGTNILHARRNLLRLNPDYSLDMGWSADAVGDVLAVAIDGTNVFVGGRFTQLAGGARLRLGKLDAATAVLDGAFNPGANAGVLDLKPDAVGLYVAGEFTTIAGVNRGYAARLDAASGVADTWSPNADDFVNVLLPSAVGIHAGGSFTSIGGQARQSLARLDVTTAAADAGFIADTDVLENVRALALDAGGNLIIGGQFSVIGASARSNLARVDAGAIVDAFDPAPSGAVHSLLIGADDGLYVGGQFSLIAGSGRDNVARFLDDDSLDGGWAPGADLDVNDLLQDAAGDILAFGDFTAAGGNDRGGMVRVAGLGAALTAISIDSIAPEPTLVGEGYSVAVTVTNLDNALIIPVGDVTVGSDIDGSCVIPALDAGGQGSCVVTSFIAGSHQISAGFRGDTGFQDASTAAPSAHAVDPASTTLAVSTTANPSGFGDAVSADIVLSATAPGSGSPSGTVDVTIDGGPGCTVDLDLLETGCTLNFASPGTYAVAASYAGDGNYGASSSGDISHEVLQVSTTTVISAQSVDPTVVGQDYDVTVTVSAADMSTPTGMVSVSSDAGESCGPVALDMAGQASCTLTSPTAGVRDLTASFVADSPWADSATGGSDTHTVNAAATTLSLDSLSPSPSMKNQTVTATITLGVDAPGAGAPTGTVSVSGAGASCDILLPASSCDLVFTTPGVDYTISASYPGDGDFDVSNDSALHTVTSIGTSIAITADNPDPSVVGQSYSVAFTVTANSGVAEGAVVVSDGDGGSCNAMLAAVDGGNGSCDLSSSNAGMKSLIASFAGSGSFDNAVSAAEAHEVDMADTSTALTPSASSVFEGDTVSFGWNVAVLAPGAGSPSGMVTVSDGGAQQCSADISAGSCDIVLSTVGDFDFVASYGGDANFNGSASAVSAVSVASGASTDTDLAIALDITGSLVLPDGSADLADFAITVSNAGPGDAVMADVSMALPAGLGAATWECAAGAGAACGTVNGSGNVLLTVDLDAGAIAVITLATTVTDPADMGINLTADITPMAGGVDPDYGNNEASTFYQRCQSGWREDAQVIIDNDDPLPAHVCRFRDGFEQPPLP